jgi:hypothetical protein
MSHIYRTSAPFPKSSLSISSLAVTLVLPSVQVVSFPVTILAIEILYRASNGNANAKGGVSFPCFGLGMEDGSSGTNTGNAGSGGQDFQRNNEACGDTDANRIED